MTSIEMQDFVHVYSLISFKEGSKLPGIVVNKYNTASAQHEYYFISHSHMHAYKAAFEKYDTDRCNELSRHVNPEDIISVRPVRLADYSIIMQLIDERQQLLNMYK